MEYGDGKFVVRAEVLDDRSGVIVRRVDRLRDMNDFVGNLSSALFEKRAEALGHWTSEKTMEGISARRREVRRGKVFVKKYSELRTVCLCGESLFRRVALCHLIEEPFLLKFLQKTHVDELLRFRRLRLRHRRRKALE